MTDNPTHQIPEPLNFNGYPWTDYEPESQAVAVGNKVNELIAYLKTKQDAETLEIIDD